MGYQNSCSNDVPCAQAPACALPTDACHHAANTTTITAIPGVASPVHAAPPSASLPGSAAAPAPAGAMQMHNCEVPCQSIAGSCQAWYKEGMHGCMMETKLCHALHQSVTRDAAPGLEVAGPLCKRNAVPGLLHSVTHTFARSAACRCASASRSFDSCTLVSSWVLVMSST